MGYIYIHTNKINGKKYIGQTTLKPSARWGKDGSGYKVQTVFYRAIQKYGWENFTHEVFELSEGELDYAEKYLIAWYSTTDSKKGYNRDLGGHSPSEEMRERMSQSHKNKPCSAHRAVRISEALKGGSRPSTQHTYRMYSETGIFLKEFKGLKACIEYLKSQGVYATCTGIYYATRSRSHRSYGYLWEEITDTHPVISEGV